MRANKKICSIKNCSNTHFGKGWCQKHYTRWWRYGTTVLKETRTLEERFEEKYIPVTESGCWIWTASTKNGYGYIRLKGKNERAHRVSYELYVGPIPKGKGYHGTCVLHKCDVRSCVNPDHLFLGTNADNIADKEEKGRGARGETNGQSILLNDDVIAIRKSTETQRILAAKYKVSRESISSIKTGRTWRHLLGANNV